MAAKAARLADEAGKVSLLERAVEAARLANAARQGGSTNSPLSLTKMKTSITKLMAAASEIKKELAKILKGKASLKRFKTIWSPEQLKRVRQVIKNLPQ